MRKFLAIVVCKLGRFVGKLVGKGSSMPGKFALKICPDILRRVQLPPHIIAVTGSNGKTSTVEMIATVLRGQGKNVIYNAEGSNQVEGVTTLILTHATLGGKVNADVLLLESDERYAAHSFKYFHPTEFVITNLYRDQLTRNGHPESVFDAILPAIHPDTELILNGDDPLSSCFAIGHEKVKWFGLNHCATDTEAPTGVYHDGAYCPVCHAPMEYDYVHYNHIGAYRCTKCGHARPAPDYAATDLDLQNGRLTLDGQFTVALAFRSIYNVYNILAAYAACRECGVEGAIDGGRTADLKALRRTLDSRPLRFADAADLERLLGLLPGQVTPLGALRAPAGTVTVVLDASLRGRTVGVHPLENTATTFLNLDDLAALLEDHGVPVIWCPL